MSNSESYGAVDENTKPYAPVLPAIGLTAEAFFGSISDEQLRKIIDESILDVFDEVFGKTVAGEELWKLANNLVDLNEFLTSVEGRECVLRLIPDSKKSELKDRVNRDISPSDANTWSVGEITRLREFFGLIDESIPSQSTPLSSASPSYGLFEHQRRAVKDVLSHLLDGERRAVLHLPTGVGKTRTAMHVIAHFLVQNEPSVVVWLASGKELLDQAYQAFNDAWSSLGNREVQTGILIGDHSFDTTVFKDGFLAIGSAKAWSMMSRSQTDWALRIAQRTRLVVFDEAHQSIARTYRQIVEELTVDYRCALLGLTATPGRTWREIDKDGELAAFYANQKVTLKVPSENPITYLIENGYLAQPNFRTLLAKPGLALSYSDRKRISKAVDIPDDVLDNIALSHQYVAAVLEAIESLLNKQHQRILVFAASVELARVIVAVLSTRGHESYVVLGTSSKNDRQYAIRKFTSQSSSPVVLVNFGVLTTGFDAPKASAVVIARPTKSLVLYSQMVGRGIRGPRAGGTATCEIVTVVDTTLEGFGDIAEAFLNWEDVWS